MPDQATNPPPKRKTLDGTEPVPGLFSMPLPGSLAQPVLWSLFKPTPWSIPRPVTGFGSKSHNVYPSGQIPKAASAHVVPTKESEIVTAYPVPAKGYLKLVAAESLLKPKAHKNAQNLAQVISNQKTPKDNLRPNAEKVLMPANLTPRQLQAPQVILQPQCSKELMPANQTPKLQAPKVIPRPKLQAPNVIITPQSPKELKPVNLTPTLHPDYVIPKRVKLKPGEVTKIAKIVVLKEDLDSTKGEEWINTTIVDAYMEVRQELDSLLKT